MAIGAQTSRLAAQVLLLAWLGPLGSGRTPGRIRRELFPIRDGRPHGRRAFETGIAPDAPGPSRLEAYLYHPPGRRLGTYLVAPGLHFDGPDDPRLDRFCRVLARAGFLVVAPFLPAHLDLLVSPSASDDLELTARALAERFPDHGPPTLFSISFGSRPAFEVAARLGDAIDGVVCFGGYADFEAALRFCLDGVMRSAEGEIRLANDPLNPPALFLNLVRHLDDAPSDPTALEAAWRRMTIRTWGRMELKAPGRLEPIANEIAREVPPAQRKLFLVGCGLGPGAAALLEQGLEKARESLRFADPAPALARLRCPVVVCHGRDDDVIPWGEADKLAALLRGRVPLRVFVTGLYGHTGAAHLGPAAFVREAGNLLGIARTLAAGGALRGTLGVENSTGF